ncbi:MAG TPA: PIG-L family deacetylase, partial [Gaiellales bacterium]
LDFGDYPLEIGRERVEAIADLMRDYGPDVVMTHTGIDPFNPDHAVAHDAVVQARGLAAGGGVASAFATITPPQLLLFEPHQPEVCGFTPTVLLDITAVTEAKSEAMAAMESQAYLQTYYGQRAEHRGNHARRVSGNGAIRTAEAFQRVLPHVVAEL